MPKLFRIEIDISVDEGADTAIMGLARTQYHSGRQAWTEENGKRVSIPVNDFIPDIESALLELIDAAFRGAVPHAEPHAFRCVLISEGHGYPGEHERHLPRRRENGAPS